MSAKVSMPRLTLRFIMFEQIPIKQTGKIRKKLKNRSIHLHEFNEDAIIFNAQKKEKKGQTQQVSSSQKLNLNLNARELQEFVFRSIVCLLCVSEENYPTATVEKWAAGASATGKPGRSKKTS